MIGRCKFKVTNILPAYPNLDPNQYPAKRVVFETQYDPSVEEDISFTKATPSGRMDVIIENTAVLAKLVVGQYVYLDINPVTEKLIG